MRSRLRGGTLLLILILTGSCSFAQSRPVTLFQNEQQIPSQLQRFVTKGSLVTIDRAAVEKLFSERPTTFTLQFTFENKLWQIELAQSELLSKGFFVKDAVGRTQSYDTAQVLHYKGKIRGHAHSFAAVSILKESVIAVLADDDGNINIGALTDKSFGIQDQHVIFREADLTAIQPFACGTSDLQESNGPLPQFSAPSFTTAVINNEPVDIYFEADYKCFQNNSNSIANTVNWATALFNVVTTLYERDSVYTRMSGIKVWNTVDPYSTIAGSSDVLYAFAANMSAGFSGDLAHFLSQRSLGGGVAYLNVLCSSAYYRTGVSGNLSNAFSQLPTYSWSTMVITHELGHNIASHHTQWCSWPGGAIDNCYTTEGGCAAGPAPVTGGTIMSYCHLTSYGINLANGFGPLPGAAIRNAVRTSTCIFPKISFSTSFQTVTEEDADVNNNCHDYKLINVKLGLNYTATAPAIISLLATNVGTPSLDIGTDKDVEVSVMNFTLTDTTPQLIQLKVYDDAVIENKESLKLDYTIAANGTNATKNGTYQLDILSLDHRPDSTVNQPVYFESFDTLPAGAAAWTQTIVYGAASPNRWLIGNSGDAAMAGGSAFISMNGSTAGYAGSSVSDSVVVRFESPVINATGYSAMKLSYLIKCNGEGSAGQGGTGVGGSGLDFGRVYYSTNNGSSWIMLKDNIYARNFKSADEVTLPAAADNNAALKIAFEWRNNSSVVNNPPFILDSIVIKGTGKAPVQSAADASNIQDAYFGPNQTVHFYNPVTKNIMATLVNKSAFDFGCTTVELIRTGTGASPAWGNYDAQKVADKSYRITPSNNNAAAPYELTLYYTAAEVAGWMAATGNALGDLSIIKTAGDITQAPPAAPFELTNVTGIVNYGTDKKISGLFSGFSTFSAGKPGISDLCAGTTQILSANELALSYQWQVNTGSGYINLANGSFYSGVNTGALSLVNVSTSWYGYKYRCIITNAQGTHNSIEYVLKFAAEWVGAANTAWENPLNWNCGTIPDANTDVFIKAAAQFYPSVNSGTTIRTLTLRSAASVNVQPGVNFVIRL